MAAKQAGNCSARRKGVGRASAELEKQQLPVGHPGEFHGCEAGRKLLREKKGCR